MVWHDGLSGNAMSRSDAQDVVGPDGKVLDVAVFGIGTEPVILSFANMFASYHGARQ